MFNPTYLIYVNLENFAGSEYICLGWQFSEILDFIKDKLPPHIWYGADIEVSGFFPWGLGMNSFELKKIGDFSAMRKIAQEIDQFQSGVFIAVPDNIKINEGSIKAGTKDFPFKGRDVEGALTSNFYKLNA